MKSKPWFIITAGAGPLVAAVHDGHEVWEAWVGMPAPEEARRLRKADSLGHYLRDCFNVEMATL